MDGPRYYHTKRSKSERERQIPYDITYTWHLKYDTYGNSLTVQWLGLCAFTAEGLGSISGRGTKIPQAVWYGKKKKKEKKTHMNLSTKQKQTHRHREQTCGCQGGGRREGLDRSSGLADANYYI